MIGIFVTLKTFKWFLRGLLITIFIIGLGYEAYNISFYSNLAYNHPTATSILIFLTVTAFIEPFVKMRKREKDGGETVMRKLSVITIIIVAALCILVYMGIFQHELLVSTLETTLGSVGILIVDFFTNLSADPIYQSYGFPIGMIFGATILYGVAKLVWPRVHKTAQKEPVWQGAPPPAVQAPAPIPAANPSPAAKQGEA